MQEDYINTYVIGGLSLGTTPDIFELLRQSEMCRANEEGYNKGGGWGGG